MDKRCVFLDRDGVLNNDRSEYTYRIEDFKILEGVPEALHTLKAKGFLLVVVTNQSGISQGLYTSADVDLCHTYLQEKCGGVIDHFYFSPYHPKITASLSRKPGTLLFEKAIAKFSINVNKSWMIGDNERDLVPARLLGIKTILIGCSQAPPAWSDYLVKDMTAASSLILSEE